MPPRCATGLSGDAVLLDVTRVRRLRLATPEDAPAVRRIYAPFVEGTAVSFEEVPPTVAEMRDRIASNHPDYPWLVAEDDAGVLGYASAGPFASRPAYRWAVECSVYVVPDAHRRGVARSLYAALFDLLDRQSYRTAHARVTLPNAASTGFHESAGFTPVGTFERAGYKHGTWHDVQWWQRDLGDAGHDAEAGPPAEPRPLTTLGGDALAAALDGPRVDVDRTASEE